MSFFFFPSFEGSLFTKKRINTVRDEGQGGGGGAKFPKKFGGVETFWFVEIEERYPDHQELPGYGHVGRGRYASEVPPSTAMSLFSDLRPLPVQGRGTQPINSPVHYRGVKVDTQSFQSQWFS